MSPFPGFSTNPNSPFPQPAQVGSPPSTLQLPTTPPAAAPFPPRNTSSSPVRMHEGGRNLSPDGRRGLNLRQALSQPTPGSTDLMGSEAPLGIHPSIAPPAAQVRDLCTPVL